jgi:excisionase family DNA binding protein
MSAIVEAPALNQTLTVEDVAKLLDVEISTVYMWARKNKLPGVVRIGRTVRFSRQVIEALLSGGGQTRCA